MSIDDDRIENLKRKLYSRNIEPVIDVRTEVKPKDVPVENAWGKNETLIIPEDMVQNTHMHPFLKKFLWFAGIFFVVSLAISAYVFFGGNDSISSSNVDIQVAGQTTVASGEEVDLAISIVNQNHTDLDLAQWTIDYPNGSYSDKDSLNGLTHSEETIGTIAKGSSVSRTVKLFLFGDKSVVKTIIFKLKYQVAGSNAIFTKEKDYDITIGSSPIILTVDTPQQISSGQEITLKSTITSNSSALLHNVLVSVQYPYGFTFKSSSSDTVAGNNNLWNIGDLKSGDKKTFSITGSLVAQDGEQRTFQFSVGTKSADPTKVIETVLGQANPTVTVIKSPLTTTLSLSGSDADSVAVQSGQTVSGIVSFTNTLPERINNISAQVLLSGTGLDPARVQVGGGGFYQSGNSTIFWDKNSDEALVSIDPGDSVSLPFSVSTKKLSVAEKNPNIQIQVKLKGNHISSDGTSEVVTSSVSKIVKISSNLSLISKTLRGGVFSNSGPNPPRAGTSSTYTIDWALSNMWNDVNGAKVTATLPPYVEWTGQVSPSTAPISYDADSRTVTWNPDAVSAGSGFSNSPKEVFFQVKINPSISQFGTTPQITNQITVSATDNYSGQAISFTSQGLTTQASDSGGSGTVTK